MYLTVLLMLCNIKCIMTKVEYIFKLKVHVKPFNVNNDWSSQYTTHYLDHFHLIMWLILAFSKTVNGCGAFNSIQYSPCNPCMHIFTNEVNIYLHQLVVSVFKKKNLLQHFSTWELLVNAQFSMISQHCTVVLNAIVKGFMLSGNPWLIIITIKLINIPNTVLYFCGAFVLHCTCLV